MHTEVWEPPHPAIPAQSQRERSNESLQMGGTQVPTYSLTAGANTVRSLVGQRSEWRGMGMEGKIQGKLKIWYCDVFQNSQRANCACSTLKYPANIFSFALFLIGFTVQNAEVCLAFFFQKFQTATLRAMGCLAAVLCFPGFQLSIEIPHLPTYFYRKPI